MSGFTYIWRDHKHNRYYIGSHWGSKDDGYICSSNTMRNAYRRRPHDFKRRILSYTKTNRFDLLAEEQRWLDMIKHNEFGHKYYNINAKSNKHYWWINEQTRKQVIKKLKKTHWCKTSKRTATLKKMSDGHKDQIPWNKGLTLTEEHKTKLRQAKIGYIPWNKGKKKEKNYE